ncbi:MAG: glycosyltransferase family 2 protein [Candidatus Sericytochromatia bacterium]
MTAPAITVLIPVYNAERTVRAAIESILAQSERDLELLVVDDGSTDGTPAILEALAAKDPRVRLVRQANAGIASALNAGLALARGRYVARMDADDLSLPTRLERQRAALDADPALGLVSCLVAHDAPDGREAAGYAWHVDWLNQLVTPEAIALARFAESPIAHPSVMFRLSLVEAHGGYRAGPFPEDYELWLRWMEGGVRFAKVPETLLVWNDEPGRLSRTHPAYAVEAFYALKARYLARWLAAHNPRHPELVIWGAGKTSKQRAEQLVAHGCVITGYVDIDPRRWGRTAYGRPIHAPEGIEGPGFGFVVSYVGARGAGAQIKARLEAVGYEEGRHFLLGA